MKHPRNTPYQNSCRGPQKWGFLGEAQDLDAFAAQGGGKLILPWPCGAALRGQATGSW